MHYEDSKITFAEKDRDRAYLAEPLQPDPEDPIPNFKESKQLKGVRYFPPALPENGEVQILLVQSTVLPEEAASIYSTDLGIDMKRKPGVGRGPLAQLLKDALNRYPSLHSSKAGFLSVVPWLLPKNRRFRPNRDELKRCGPWVRQMISGIKPEVIVTMGKDAFQAVTGNRIRFDDAVGGWWSTENGTPVLAIEGGHRLLTQPWTLSNLYDDFREVERFYASGFSKTGDNDFHYSVIDTAGQLRELVEMWRSRGLVEFSVDCEWGGSNHLTGRLRSIQFCWADKEAAYLRFFDHEGQTYLGYDEAAKVLGSYLNLPGIRYLGHHFAADSPWMEHVLKLDIYGRCCFDSEYALQTVDEYSPLGLERLALKYTSFGRYDMDLVLWKRENPIDEDDGYATIPDDILIPYAVKDVLVVWRSRKPIEARMVMDDVLNYYRSLLLPFVSDVFHGWIMHGLPVNMERFEAVRVFMNWSYDVLLKDFREALTEQARNELAEQSRVPVFLIESSLEPYRNSGERTKALTLLNQFAAPLGGREFGEQDPYFSHWWDVPGFNIRSQPQMRRWLFDVMCLTPIKTTSNKAQGVPAMMWEKVLELPEKARALVSPAVDKETIEILADQEPSGLLHRLLAVSNVGNQCKGFLKAGQMGPDGETVKENGLAKFIGPDTRIHGQYSLTETSRPRSWKPNILNLSSYHNKGVEAGLLRILDKHPELEIPAACAPVLGTREQIEEEVQLAIEKAPEEKPEDIRKSVLKGMVKKRVPTVRSTIMADPGWVFVESDYKTAEIRSLAYVFEDAALIRLMTETDPSFAITKSGEQVRLFYADDCGIPPEARNTEWEMKVVEEGAVKKVVTPDDLLRDGEGKVINPGYDLHWSLAELVYGKPREELSSKKDRGSAKVANFSCAYGAVATTIERRIEAVTGVKPEPGTGERLLAALEKRQPAVFEGLNEVAQKPARGETLRAASGRLRRFPTHPRDLAGLSWRVRKGILRAMGNEARNFFPQESVAATLARACVWLQRFYRSNGMKARTMIGLYDSVVTHCPLEERFVCAKAHEVMMDVLNFWKYGERWMSYPIDTELNYCWSWPPSKEEKKVLSDDRWNGMDPERQRELMKKLDLMVDMIFSTNREAKKSLDRSRNS